MVGLVRKSIDDPVALFTIVLAISTIRLWLETRRLALGAEEQSETIKEQVALARSEFASEYRPWVSVDALPVGGLSWDVNGASATFQFQMKNSGRTPAQNVWVHARFAVLTGDPRKIQEQLCSPLLSQPRKAFGFTIFPSEMNTLNIGLTMPHAELQAHYDNFTKNFGHEWKTFSAVLVGCVDYMPSFSETHYQTGFIYTLHRRDPMHPHVHFMLEHEKSLTMDLLGFEKEFFFGGGYTI